MIPMLPFSSTKRKTTEKKWRKKKETRHKVAREIGRKKGEVLVLEQFGPLILLIRHQEEGNGALR